MNLVHCPSRPHLCTLGRHLRRPRGFRLHRLFCHWCREALDCPLGMAHRSLADLEALP